MDWDDAYAIQDAILVRKLSAGLRLAGLKAGLTSHAKMKQMGVATPVFGFMTDDYALPDGAECKVSELIHPKVEPEIAFVTKRALKGPGCHIGAVLAATDFVIPGIEVIDSRYRDFKFDLKSVVADNTSASRFVIGGQALPADEVDLRTLASCSRRTARRWPSARAPRCWAIRPRRSRCWPITWEHATRRSRPAR
jgi:2-oxo-3-hexenedioate decarboxylase